MADTGQNPDATRPGPRNTIDRGEITVAPAWTTSDRWLRYRPPLSAPRIALACVVAVVFDVLQFVLGPLGWIGVDQFLDVIAMAIMIGLLGFHPLFLPTFILEAIPFVDEIPTWTACVVAVIVLRRRQVASRKNSG